jgi:hypothetical protein
MQQRRGGLSAPPWQLFLIVLLLVLNMIPRWTHKPAQQAQYLAVRQHQR